MRYVAVVVGLSGKEFFLARDNSSITQQLTQARTFGSERPAGIAARAHIERQAPVVRKYMAFRVEPRP